MIRKVKNYILRILYENIFALQLVNGKDKKKKYLLLDYKVR